MQLLSISEALIEFGVNGCKQLLLEWISNEILLYGTENYVWSLMMEQDNGRKKECIHVCVTGSLCYTAGKKLYWRNNNKKNYSNKKSKKRISNICCLFIGLKLYI